MITAVDDEPVPAKKPTDTANACAVAVFVPSAVTVRPLPPLIVPSNSAIVAPSIFASGNVALTASPKPPPPASEVAVAVFAPVAVTKVEPDVPEITAPEPTNAFTSASVPICATDEASVAATRPPIPTALVVAVAVFVPVAVTVKEPAWEIPPATSATVSPLSSASAMKTAAPTRPPPAPPSAVAVARFWSPNRCASTVTPFVTETDASEPTSACVTAVLKISASAVAPPMPARIETETTNVCASALFDEVAVTVK